MDEVCHLHELEIVLQCGVTFACKLMLHAIAGVLQGVEAFVIDFPTQASDATGGGNVFAIDG